jgi:hypothetical protein
VEASATAFVKDASVDLRRVATSEWRFKSSERYRHLLHFGGLNSLKSFFFVSFWNSLGRHFTHSSFVFHKQKNFFKDGSVHSKKG